MRVRGVREKREKEREFFKIYQRVFDERALRLLAQLAGKGFFKSLDFPISTGKEADVYRATAADGSFRALKIYRIETSNFRRMSYYVAADPRFRVKHNRRALVEVWCQKEYRNLLDAYNAGLAVPRPLKVFKQILVFEFVGEGGTPAPLLKDVKVKPGQAKRAVETMSKFVKDLWTKAGLVHGDLSEYNIMMLAGDLVVFDMAQAVSTKSPLAIPLLQRDLHNLEHYAQKKGVRFDAEKAFAEIQTG